MPAILCQSCNSLTNTALADHLEPGGKCRVRVNTTTGRWEMGCQGQAYPWEHKMIGQPVIINDQIISPAELEQSRSNLAKAQNTT
jgi:hypothetical protein